MLLLALALASAPSVSATSEQGPPAGRIAVTAGTIHLVEGGEVIRGGGVILIRDGKIAAVGKDLPIPPGTPVIDYGPDAVVVPGFVAADSSYGSWIAGARTAEPSLMAVDGFDPYASFPFALAGGVTSAYLAPARGRLIAGQGAMVKLAGKPGPSRVLAPSVALHGSISAEARNTPGFWEPPVPATVETGLGVVQPQLPRSIMGAVVALQELFDLAQRGGESAEYGRYAGPELAELLARRTAWRMGAETAPEIRALLGFFDKKGLPLVVDGAYAAGELADELAKAKVSVIYEPSLAPNQRPRELGKDTEALWPRFDGASRLAQAGVPFAIASPKGIATGELLFAAKMALRGGLADEAALRAITLSPAEILGVADRVGSLAVGKDADLAVLNGEPLSPTSSVLATWVDGEVAWKIAETAATVIEVEELFTGDGDAVGPAEILMRDGRIAEVGRRVAHPLGATVVRGRAAMPGMIDALGHLGLEDSRKIPATRFPLARLVEPGDSTDRRVARAGVTTVVLSPRGGARKGAPVMAYKPAATELDRQVVEDPTALRFEWSDANRAESGDAVRDTLKKAADYERKWREYDEAIAKWTPPPPGKAHEAEKADKAEKKDESAEGAKKNGEAEKDAKAGGEESGSAKDDESKDKDKEKDKAKKSKKKEEEPPKPVTGAWVGSITLPPFEASRLRLYLLDENGTVTGSLRCAALTDGLIDVRGKREERTLGLSGRGSKGPIDIQGKIEEGKLTGTAKLGSAEIAFTAEQTSAEYEIAKRSERHKPPEEKKEEIKGKPKAPTLDPDLEPLRKAMRGETAVIVDVDRADEILDCVDAFEEAGLMPVLYGAEDAHKVAERIQGRVAGILLSPEIVRTESRTGVEKRNRYAELVQAGIRVAFHSDAEEGAAELPLMAAFAVSQGMSPEGALRSLTADAADMLAISDRVGRIAEGLDADVLLLDGDPLDPGTSVVRTWVNGEEIR